MKESRLGGEGRIREGDKYEVKQKELRKGARRVRGNKTK